MPEDADTSHEDEPAAATDSVTPPPEPEVKGAVKEEKTKSNETRIALAGILATLITAIIGSISTYVVSTTQARTQSEQSAVDFRKNQQKVAYADFLSTCTQLINDEYNVVGVLKQYDPKTWNPEDINGEVKTVGGDMISGSQKRLVVSLVASPNTNRAAVEATDELNGIFSELVSVTDAVRAGQSPAQRLDALASRLENFDPFIVKFVDAGAKDLGVYG